MNSKNKNRLFWIGLFGVFGLIPNTVHANNTSYFGIKEVFLYDTNPNMRTNNSESIFGLASKLSFVLDRETPISNFNSDISVTQNNFDDSDFNSTDFLLNTNYKKQLLQWQYGIEGLARYDTTRNEDLSNVDISNQSDRRLTLGLSPYISYNLSPLTQISLNANWQSVTYDNDNLVDYNVVTATPTINYKPHPLHNIHASLKTRHHETTDDNNRSVNSVGPYFGWDYNFHPKYTLAIFGGVLASKLDGYSNQDDGWQISPIYSTRLHYTGEQSDTLSDISRSREVYPNGAEYDQTQFRFENIFSINPLWSFDTKLSYKNIESSQIFGNDLDSVFEEYMALNYNPADQWGITLSQQYRHDELENGSQANRNIIKLGLKYNFGGARGKIRD